MWHSVNLKFVKRKEKLWMSKFLRVRIFLKKGTVLPASWPALHAGQSGSWMAELNGSPAPLKLDAWCLIKQEQIIAYWTSLWVWNTFSIIASTLIIPVLCLIPSFSRHYNNYHLAEDNYSNLQSLRETNYSIAISQDFTETRNRQKEWPITYF